ncbi:LirA/MavJ family T4SS effector [Plastoroseomonas hellenica]|uniref:DUF5636 domain-containing protein n=1 Tax=Plastoroseomonas hellenica TaxID=2687306 RepID=A0ABS5EU74_9PROT|nr:LirA/MavJ family T4SS effector [Plastoroseomonas hellenica]MBR0641541.1 hypothetical protein [Plastoroseomonas hellenica]MBR0663846.1 hypothetical protein [Plastoroseomonas hellenica]
MPNGSRWDRGGNLSLDRYRGLDFRRSYHRIHDFLREEPLVRAGLERLHQATAGMDRLRFQGYLAKEEQRFGFAKKPGVIPQDQSLLKASRFWTHLFNGEPLIDLGAGDKGGHGVLTHRVQWVLVGQWNERNDASRQLEAPIPVLYRNLAAGGARVLSADGQDKLAAGDKIDTGKGSFFDSVWDDVFDSQAENATSPEQVFGYTERHYSGLHDRMLWQDASAASPSAASPPSDSSD